MEGFCLRSVMVTQVIKRRKKSEVRSSREHCMRQRHQGLVGEITLGKDDLIHMICRDQGFQVHVNLVLIAKCMVNYLFNPAACPDVVWWKNSVASRCVAIILV